MRHTVDRCAFFAIVAFACLTISACAGSGQGSYLASSASLGAPNHYASALPFGLRNHGGSNPITHVVIIIQENESFDHLFNGYPGANTAQSGLIHTGATVPLTKLALGAATNTGHIFEDFLADYDAGKLDGFDLNTQGPKPDLLAYTYIDPNDIKPYYTLAGQYVLADNFFTSHVDGSFVSHQYLIAAQSADAVNLPNGKWGCEATGVYVPTMTQQRTIGPFETPCFTYKTLADELDAAGLSWHFYAPLVTQQSNGGQWSAYQAVSQIYHGPDWSKDVISPETQILTDIPNGILSNVTWVVPDLQNSDHPGSNGKGGPDWVASIVNAIGQSSFWDSTMIFVTWDEWGGEYDHVPPPYEDFDGDGFRVPLLCISPYAYTGVVNHNQLEASGIVRYVENTFGLATLAAADARAKPADYGCTNPSQSTPRSFSTIGTSFKRDHFIHEKPSGQPPDDS